MITLLLSGFFLGLKGAAVMFHKWCNYWYDFFIIIIIIYYYYSLSHWKSQVWVFRTCTQNIPLTQLLVFLILCKCQWLLTMSTGRCHVKVCHHSVLAQREMLSMWNYASWIKTVSRTWTQSWEALLCSTGIKCNSIKQVTEAFTITVFPSAIWRQSEVNNIDFVT